MRWPAGFIYGEKNRFLSITYVRQFSLNIYMPKIPRRDQKIVYPDKC